MDIKSKILLTAIFKDDTEYEMINRMLTSFMPCVSGLAVAITGISKDNKKIKALIKKHKGTYIETSPETHPKLYLKTETGYIFGNFAEARNEVFRLADTLNIEAKYDWYLWADADDVLVGGEELQECAAKASTMALDSVFFTYWYSVALDPKGNIKEVLIEHLRERLLRPGIFKWVSRLHEVALPLDSNYQPKNSLYDYNPKEGRNTAWAHVVTDQRMKDNLMRNINILHKQIEEEQSKDPRTIFYLAKTYYDIHTPDYFQRADLLIDEYLKLSGWPEERSNAWEYKGNIRAFAQDHRGAIDCYHMAIKEYPDRHMPYLLLAKEYSELGLNTESKFWLEMVLRMEKPSTRTTIGNPLEIKVLAASLKYNHAIREQQVDEAIKWLETRNKLIGIEDDGMLKTLQDAKLLNEAAIWVFNYCKWLKEKGHTDKVHHVLDSLPYELGREQFALHIANDIAEPRKWEKNEIAYFASFGGEHFEQWSGKSLDKGIGGSETAVIELARKWAEKGYKVTVFGDPREDEGVIDGVTYKPWYTCNWNDEFNIVILWRAPFMLDRNIKAKKIFMDLHDIASQLDWSDERMKKVTKVFFKSQAHRKMLPKLPEDKAVIVSNGI